MSILIRLVKKHLLLPVPGGGPMTIDVVENTY
jgi:hypothetical protein